MTAPQATKRNRFGYASAALGAVGLGLASRRFPVLVPAALGKYPGDAIWALMMFFALGALFPKASRARLPLGTLLVCFTVECMKLYQAPWLVAVRHSTLGHLVLGHSFSWQNLVAYGVGTLTGVLLELGCRSLRGAR